MRPVLVVSLLAAFAAVGAAAYQFVPGRTPKAAKGPVPVVMADPNPYRVIPMDSKGKVVPRPDKPAVAATAAPAVEANAVAAAEPPAAPAPDVLASVARTLDAMKPGEEPGAVAATAGLTPPQEDALRQMAARRKVRPVTRMSFALEPGAEVPQQVYLHPVPPEVAGIAAGALGFAMVGNRIVVVATDTRKVVAVTGG